ncbi:MAG: hypothetical protein V8Q76_06960 [Bacteroides intestinalis]
MDFLTNEGIILSATSVLNHEVDHALQHDQNPEQQKADGKRNLTNPYTNKEEEKGSLLVLNKKLQKNWEKLKMVKLPERIMVEHCMK